MARDYYKEYKVAKENNNFGIIERLYFELCTRLDLRDESATGSEGAQIAAKRNAESKGEGEIRGIKL